MSPLCHLLQEARDPSAEVAHRWDPTTRSDQVVTWSDFRSHVVGLSRRISAGPEGAWVLLTEDAYAYAVGLFALWHAGRHAISPPNRQLGSLQELEVRAAGVLSDHPEWFPRGAPLDPLAEALAEPRADASATLTPLSRDAVALELYTSGTTGGEKAVMKRIRHLEDEVRELSASWDGLLRSATVFASASHQHLYGLLFGVLWPLAAGRCFQAQHFLQVGELVPRMRSSQDCILASVPTHLKRLVRHSDAAALGDRCRVVFSSGGPLATETAHQVAHIVGRAPLEVLGSTETGGVAWRAQEPEQPPPPWTPLPAVRVTRDSQEGVMRVQSPFVSVGGGREGFATSDRITLLSDGRFELGGRSDRIVKVGEKRLDLGRMESQLRGEPWVAEVALTTLERDPEPRVAAAVVPTEKGWEVVRSEGRKTFERALRSSLAKAWDAVLHPRYWRVVEQLPENAQGKVTLEGLSRLFEDVEGRNSGATAADRPLVLEERQGSDFIERSCRVPEDLACFAGHFPDLPVVPGVLQLDWALELAGELLNETPIVEEIVFLKFASPLRPGARFEIRVRAAERRQMSFELWSEGEEHASARLRLGSTRVEPLP